MTTTEACEEATRRLGIPPIAINSGRCFEWATIVFDLIRASKIAGNNVNGHGHCWIEYEGLCYDSECPHGVQNWTDLPFFGRIKSMSSSREIVL